ncbi:adenosylhomocysteinase [Kribbella sp. VKM Ac-2527]|uniref:Adenosylhomocysteinase n=1 Tax=Kribbella caucasensis TaxID=2512215 RepID=A0A4R6KD23_9ACTN|nr:NAD(P)-dependent oxidoreductase [Kribbella sp. VKM Ac-2527]TDO46365.1 adenosylhomocysteinase [Kribbella sp. VKM Ac-2527]
MLGLPETAWQGIGLEQRLRWTRRWMVRTAAASRGLPSLAGVRLAVTAHCDLKMAVVIEGWRAAGAEVMVHPADPATTQPDVGIEVATVEECVGWQPTHTLEMGGDIVVHAAQTGYDGIRAGVEVTRTGLNRVAAVGLRHPVFDLDSVPLKNHLHNRFAVGTSTWQTVLSRTQLSLHGLIVAVIGYGEVGAGLARTARDHGAQVLVAEVDPARATVASYDGFGVGEIREVVGRANIVVTATGRSGVLSADVLGVVADGCLLVNAGHSADEIDLVALGKGEPVIPAVTSHRVGGREVLLFADGHVANLAAGDGDSLNAFDITAALLASSVGWMVTHGDAYPPGLHPWPLRE